MKNIFIDEARRIKKIPDDYVYGEGRYCDNCFSQNIDYGRFYRICKDCKSSINTEKVLWG